jgi:hypothetical protein
MEEIRDYTGLMLIIALCLIIASVKFKKWRSDRTELKRIKNMNRTAKSFQDLPPAYLTKDEVWFVQDKGTFKSNGVHYVYKEF